MGLTEKAVCAATELLLIRTVKFGISVIPTSQLPFSNWKTESSKYCLLHLEQGSYLMAYPAFCLVTEKSQTVVQLAKPGNLNDNLSISVTGNPLLAVLLGFKFCESCYNDTHA